MATDPEIDLQIRRVLAQILAEGGDYSGIPLVDPETGLFTPAVTNALRAPLEVAIGDLDEAVGNIQPAVASLETLVGSGRLSEPELSATMVAQRGEGLVITVGSGGDFATLNAALDAASRISPRYVRNGLAIEVRLLAGYVMQEQVMVYQRDLSFVKVTSVDSDNGTPVTIRRSAMTDVPNVSNWRPGVFPAFTAMNGGRLPAIGCQFEFDTTGTGVGTVGIHVKEGGWCTVLRHADGKIRNGVTKAGWRGLYADNGFVYARFATFDEAGLAGGPDAPACIRAANGSVVVCRDSYARNGTRGLYVSQSYVDALYLDMSGSVSTGGTTGEGARITGASKVALTGGKADDCAYDAIFASEGSSVAIDLMSILNAGRRAVQAESGAVVTGATVAATGATKRVVNASTGARVSLPSLTGGSADEYAAAANSGAVVDLHGATIGTSGTQATLAAFGGTVNAPGATISKGSATAHATVSSAGTIDATGARDAGNPLTGNVVKNERTPAGIITDDSTPGATALADASSSVTLDAARTYVLDVPLTTNRVLSVNSGSAGVPRFRVIRTANSTGASTLSVNKTTAPTATLAVLNAGQWAEFAVIGGEWMCVARGAL